MEYNSLLNECEEYLKSALNKIISFPHNDADIEAAVGAALYMFTKVCDEKDTRVKKIVKNQDNKDFCPALRFIYNQSKHQNHITISKTVHAFILNSSTLNGDDVLNGSLRWTVDTKLVDPKHKKDKSLKIYLKILHDQSVLDSIKKAITIVEDIRDAIS